MCGFCRAERRWKDTGGRDRVVGRRGGAGRGGSARLDPGCFCDFYHRMDAVLLLPFFLLSLFLFCIL